LYRAVRLLDVKELVLGLAGITKKREAACDIQQEKREKINNIIEPGDLFLVSP
jgi:hypothetical protein